MQKYETPEMEIVILDSADVITTSNNMGEEDTFDSAIVG